MNLTIFSWVGAIAVALAAAFIWPTLYRYDRISNGAGASTVIRTNRFTSQVQTLNPNGWQSPQTWRDRAISLSK